MQWKKQKTKHKLRRTTHKGPLQLTERRKSILNNKTTSMKSINTLERNDREMKLLDTLTRAENDGGTVVLRWRRDWRRDGEIEGLTAERLTDCGSSTAKDWGIVGLRDGEIDRLEIKDWRIRDYRLRIEGLGFFGAERNPFFVNGNETFGKGKNKLRCKH
jgi:hypothetical protein